MIDKRFMIFLCKCISGRIWQSYSNVVKGNLYESSQLDSTVKYALYKEIQLQQISTNIIHPRYTKRSLLPGENSQRTSRRWKPYPGG
jgi:hypothetical protein